MLVITSAGSKRSTPSNADLLALAAADRPGRLNLLWFPRPDAFGLQCFFRPGDISVRFAL